MLLYSLLSHSDASTTQYLAVNETTAIGYTLAQGRVEATHPVSDLWGWQQYPCDGTNEGGSNTP